MKKNDLKLINLASELKANPTAGFNERTYVARELIQLTLPHRQPNKNSNGDLPPVWQRQNGAIKLVVKPGYISDAKSGEYKCIGYPSGTIPRLILFWLNSEVVKNKSRKIELAESYNEFLRKIGFSPNTGGGERSDRKRVALETERLFKATISFEYNDAFKTSWLDMPVAPKGSLWWNISNPAQKSLFDSWIELGEDFFNCLNTSPVPLDTRILSYFKGTPLGLDISAWLSYRVYTVTVNGKSTFITWKQIHDQFGSNYSEISNFKKKAVPIIKKLMIMEPKLGVDIINGGLKIRPSEKLLSKFS